MTHGQLFAGIGGFGLAAQWAGIKNVWANEIDPYCCKVLRKNFPNMNVYEKDIKEVCLPYVDIISGGFPCQPFSHAGQRRGTEDDRHLWPEMLRVISEVRPQWVIGENVAGLLSMENGETLERILSDLEDQDYRTQTYIIPASACGASHNRSRIWIIAYSGGIANNIEGAIFMDREKICKNGINGVNIWSQHHRNYEFDVESRTYETTKFRVFGTNDGIPNRMDRIKGLGNAIVPQVAYQIFKAIIDETILAPSSNV